MVDSAFLFWLELSRFLKKQGYIMNPYDICCMNKMINVAQCTVVCHVDDIKASHIDKEVIIDLIKSIQKEYGKYAPLPMTRGKVHK